MIVDTSAIYAIIKQEDDGAVFQKAMINATGQLRISAGTMLEATVVAARAMEPAVHNQLQELVADLNLEIVDFTAAQAQIAMAAYRKFGRGSGHPARLNFGDCFTYALTKESGEPLLYKGEDFRKTDIDSFL